MLLTGMLQVTGHSQHKGEVGETQAVYTDYIFCNFPKAPGTSVVSTGITVRNGDIGQSECN